MTTIASCRTCGAEPRPDARFCDSCGSPLAVVDQRAEYKQVTVLFADVVHSMEIAAAVGPKRLREIMTDLIHQASVVVQQYGGTVNQFTGDGLMAVFGAPIALEDHAFRACLTALDIQREAQHLGAMEKLRLGDVDGAIQLARPTVDFLYSSGEMTTRGLAVEVLVESLLRRGPIQT